MILRLLPKPNNIQIDYEIKNINDLFSLLKLLFQLIYVLSKTNMLLYLSIFKKNF